MPTVADITADLAAEHDALEAILTPLSAEQWALATPSPGWDIADQVGAAGYLCKGCGDEKILEALVEAVKAYQNPPEDPEEVPA